MLVRELRPRPPGRNTKKTVPPSSCPTTPWNGACNGRHTTSAVGRSAKSSEHLSVLSVLVHRPVSSLSIDRAAKMPRPRYLTRECDVCGAGNPARSRFSVGLCDREEAPRSRLKGGCGHDWPPHGATELPYSVRDYLYDALAAVIFYFTESGDRQKQNTTKPDRSSTPRRARQQRRPHRALQELNLDHVPLVGVNAAGAFLQGIQLQTQTFSAPTWKPPTCATRACKRSIYSMPI
jgi:hypothetical protein